MCQPNEPNQPLGVPPLRSAEHDPDVDLLIDWLTFALEPNRGAAVIDRLVKDDAFHAKAKVVMDQIAQVEAALSGDGPWPAEPVDPEFVARVANRPEIESEPMTAEEEAYVRALIREGESPPNLVLNEPSAYADMLEASSLFIEEAEE